MSILFDRRQSIQALGTAALAFSIPQFSSLGDDRTATDREISSWLDRLYRNAAKLKGRDISSLQWQETMDEIYKEVPLQGLKKRLDFPKLQKNILDKIGADRGELFQRVELPGSSNAATKSGEPRRALITKVAHIKKGRSIPPHGHSNMASAFFVHLRRVYRQAI